MEKRTSGLREVPKERKDVMVFLTTLVLVVVMMVAMQAWTVKTPSSREWERRMVRRSVLRHMGENRKQRPRALLHLTEEQWQSHMEAFVDYQCNTGKYRNFTGLIAEWLEREGLPPTPALTDPLVRLTDSSGQTIG
jgi:hypothetical protein